MENNHDIDKKFNEASRSVEDPVTFPGFDGVWAKVEEKLDKKEKKRSFPLWFPYGMAASLIIGLGAFYFMNKKETVEIAKTELAQNAVSSKENDHIYAIDSTVKSNIEKEIERKAPKEIRSELAVNQAAVISDHYSKINKPDINISYLPSLPSHILTDTVKVKDIEEVVVLGYSKLIRKESVTASSTVLIASTDKVSADVRRVLKGSVAGLKVNPGREIPEKSNFSIREMHSLGKYSAPLFVIDGFLAGKSSKIFNIIEPEKIKELKVIKGKEATTLYGDEASTGVILITTTGLTLSEKQKIKQIASDKTDELIIKPEEEKELPKAGQLTAGEVNDFSKWDYWKDMALPVLDKYKNEWKFFPDRRVSVQLINRDRKPVIGEKIKLLNDRKEVIWEAVSDNLGNAEMWIDPLQKANQVSGKYYLSDASGQIISSNIREFKNGQNLIMSDRNCLTKRTLDLVFVVDATGSMGDEISYLQSELLDVLKKVEGSLKNTEVRYGSVFYRDHGDEYVTRKFDFSDHAEDLIGFIKNQQASGGGDFPEAVAEAMQVSVDELNWSTENSTKIMFLILDAPPHQSEENISKLYEKVKAAAKKGITIIPLAASDIDKQTEYLMRTFALLTNGTYTFLTDDSGIGHSHIKPTVDSYEVEKLNDLLLRLILQRATLPECNTGISNDYLNKKLETEVGNQVDSKTKVFPNPTKGLVNIKTDKPIDELFVYDLAGKIIMRKENLKDNKTIDITAYPQSIYLLRLRLGEVWETFKIIKNQ